MNRSDQTHSFKNIVVLGSDDFSFGFGGEQSMDNAICHVIKMGGFGFFEHQELSRELKDYGPNLTEEFFYIKSEPFCFETRKGKFLIKSEANFLVHIIYLLPLTNEL